MHERFLQIWNEYFIGMMRLANNFDNPCIILFLPHFKSHHVQIKRYLRDQNQYFMYATTPDTNVNRAYSRTIGSCYCRVYRIY